jgi:hypothetical protein
MIRKRHIGKHAKDCYALRMFMAGKWDSPWACPEMVFRNKRGYKGHGYTTWILYKCNSPDCKAQLLLHSDDVLNAAGECEACSPYERVAALIALEDDKS